MQREILGRRVFASALALAMLLILPVNVLTARAEEYEWNEVTGTVTDTSSWQFGDEVKAAIPESIATNNYYIYSTSAVRGYIVGYNVMYNNGSGNAETALDSYDVNNENARSSSYSGKTIYYATIKAAPDPEPEAPSDGGASELPDVAPEASTGGGSSDPGPDISNQAATKELPVGFGGKENTGINMKLGGGNAKISEVSKDVVKSMIASTASANSDTISIDLDVSDYTVSSIALSKTNAKTIVEAASEENYENISFKGTDFEATMSTDLLEYFASTPDTYDIRLVVNPYVSVNGLSYAKQENIKDKEVAAVFTSYIESNMSRIVDLKAEISFELYGQLGITDTENYHLYRILSDGSLEEVDMTFDGNTVKFSNDVLGDFVVIYE